MVLTGGCHCGNLQVRFETAIAPEETAVRVCQCSFCRRHGARAATDPDGHLSVEIRDRERLSRYSFALRTADFLICATCGVFVAAVMEADGQTVATLNVNALDERARFPPGAPMSYEGEDAAGRIARRRARWTPATVR
jgi:hypothetical protein